MLRIQASFLAAILVCTNYLPKAFQSLFWVASALIAQTTHKQSMHSLGLWVAPVSPKGLSYLLLDNLCATELNLHPSLTSHWELIHSSGWHRNDQDFYYRKEDHIIWIYLWQPVGRLYLLKIFLPFIPLRANAWVLWLAPQIVSASFSLCLLSYCNFLKTGILALFLSF